MRPAGQFMRVAPISLSRILTAVLVIVVLMSLPGAIWRVVHSGDLYLFTRQFFVDMLARLSGPGRLRFILQPAVAILLGVRHGLSDARAHRPPFLWTLAFRRSERGVVLREAVSAIRDVVVVAILLDLISQAIIFHLIRPGAALILGPVLIAVPYVVARAIANRIAQARHREARAAQAR